MSVLALSPGHGDRPDSVEHVVEAGGGREVDGRQADVGEGAVRVDLLHGHLPLPRAHVLLASHGCRQLVVERPEEGLGGMLGHDSVGKIRFTVRLKLHSAFISMVS